MSLFSTGWGRIYPEGGGLPYTGRVATCKRCGHQHFANGFTPSACHNEACPSNVPPSEEKDTRVDDAREALAALTRDELRDLIEQVLTTEELRDMAAAYYIDRDP